MGAFVQQLRATVSGNSLGGSGTDCSSIGRLSSQKEIDQCMVVERISSLRRSVEAIRSSRASLSADDCQTNTKVVSHCASEQSSGAMYQEDKYVPGAETRGLVYGAEQPHSS